MPQTGYATTRFILVWLPRHSQAGGLSQQRRFKFAFFRCIVRLMQPPEAWRSCFYMRRAKRAVGSAIAAGLFIFLPHCHGVNGWLSHNSKYSHSLNAVWLHSFLERVKPETRAAENYPSLRQPIFPAALFYRNTDSLGGWWSPNASRTPPGSREAS